MKAILKFKLPEEQYEHSYALAGTDALLTIEDLLAEIRYYLKHGGGIFREFNTEIWSDETNQFEKKTMCGCEHTLEKVRDLVIELKQRRKLPELV
jgi:hypothetical protein